MPSKRRTIISYNEKSYKSMRRAADKSSVFPMVHVVRRRYHSSENKVLEESL